MANDPLLSNSRLTKMYVEHLRLNYPHVKVASVVEVVATLNAGVAEKA
jgi:hypothetical protein